MTTQERTGQSAGSVDETDLDALHRLRRRMEQEEAGPAEPPHVAEAARRLSALHEEIARTAEPLRRYELERESQSIAQALLPELRALERARRDGRRRAAKTREELRRAVLAVYADRRRRVARQVAGLLAEAGRELSDLEALRLQLEEQFPLPITPDLESSHLARLIAEAERVRCRLTDRPTPPEPTPPANPGRRRRRRRGYAAI